MVILLLVLIALGIVMVILEEFENVYTKLTLLGVLLLIYVFLTVVGGNFSG